MLPSYHHGGSMQGHGSKPAKRHWVPDLNGTLIAIIVLAFLLTLEHFHFQSRLTRVSSLEASLAKQLKDLQTSEQQHTDQLHRISPKLDEIDTAEHSLKRLQEEVLKTKNGLLDVRAGLKELQDLNITAQLTEATQQIRKQISDFSAQLEALQSEHSSLRSNHSSAQTALSAVAGNVSALVSRVTQLEADTSKMSSKLDSHNSALKTLADQLSIHQNSTLSALQQQTAAVSEALEAHRELQTRVEKLGATAAGAQLAADSTTSQTKVQSTGAGTSSSSVGDATSKPTSAGSAGSGGSDAGTGGAATTSGSGASAAGTGEAAGGAAVGAAGASGGAASTSTTSSSSEEDHLVRDSTGLELDDGADGSGAAGNDTTTDGTAATGTRSASAEGGSVNATSSTAPIEDMKPAATSTAGNSTLSATVTNTTGTTTSTGSSTNSTGAEGATAAGGSQASVNSTAALDLLHALVSTGTSEDKTEGEGDATVSGDYATTGADQSKTTRQQFRGGDFVARSIISRRDRARIDVAGEQDASAGVTRYERMRQAGVQKDAQAGADDVATVRSVVEVTSGEQGSDDDDEFGVGDTVTIAAVNEQDDVDGLRH